MTGAIETRIVIIDNYDSYVYNLYQRIGELTGLESTVVRNDRTTLADLRALRCSQASNACHSC